MTEALVNKSAEKVEVQTAREIGYRPQIDMAARAAKFPTPVSSAIKMGVRDLDLYYKDFQALK
ncbi:MAG: phosphate ABC transporter ATP-binding protein, partial [Raoultibacter sp.]